MRSLEETLEHHLDPARAARREQSQLAGELYEDLMPYSEQERLVSIRPQEWREARSPFHTNRESAVRDLRRHEGPEFDRLRAKGYFHNALPLRYFNDHFFPGLKNQEIINGFAGKQYWLTRNFGGTRLARFEPLGGILSGRPGGWWTRMDVMPFSQMQGMTDSAIVSEWNEFEFIAVMTIPKGNHLDLFEGEAGPQTTYIPKTGNPYSALDGMGRPLINTKRRFPRFAGSIYMGGGNQMFLPREISSQVNLDPRYYELYIRNSSGQITRLNHSVINGKIKIDTAQLKRDNLFLHDRLASLAAERKMTL